jgi:hypothetical protein
VREIRLFAADLPKMSKPHAISTRINEVLTGKHDFSISLAIYLPTGYSRALPMDGGLPEGKEKTFSSVPKKRHGVRLLLTVSLVTQKFIRELQRYTLEAIAASK